MSCVISIRMFIQFLLPSFMVQILGFCFYAENWVVGHQANTKHANKAARNTSSLFRPCRWLVWVLWGSGWPRAVAGNQRAAWAAGAESHRHPACGGLHRSRPWPHVPGAPGVPQADPRGDAAHRALPGLWGRRGWPDHSSLAVYHCGNWLKGVRRWALCELQLHFEKLKHYTLGDGGSHCSAVLPLSGRPNAQPVYFQRGGGGGGGGDTTFIIFLFETRVTLKLCLRNSKLVRKLCVQPVYSQHRGEMSPPLIFVWILGDIKNGSRSSGPVQRWVVDRGYCCGDFWKILLNQCLRKRQH